VSPLLSSESFEQLRAQSQSRLVDFLAAEIDLAFTFVDFAVTERNLGNLEHFNHALHDARLAIRTANHFLPRVADPAIRTAARSRLSELEKSLADL
jgi:hypothetical protein